MEKEKKNYRFVYATEENAFEVVKSDAMTLTDALNNIEKVFDVNDATKEDIEYLKKKLSDGAEYAYAWVDNVDEYLDCIAFAKTGHMGNVTSQITRMRKEIFEDW